MGPAFVAVTLLSLSTPSPPLPPRCGLCPPPPSPQAHLPLHCDESVLSLTLALNDGFEGGGTFFAHLEGSHLAESSLGGSNLRGCGAAVRSAGPGSAVLFEGRALHGGHPVVRGTRYVLAAFFYIHRAPPGGGEGEGGEAAPRQVPWEEPRAAKKPRLFDSSQGGAAPSFSFGFQF